MQLKDYIKSQYAGDKESFAKSVGVVVQQVDKWLRMDCIVYEGKLYSPRREIEQA